MTPPHGFGRYQIVGRIGAGGMGEVFLAKQVGAGGFEKLVVIKRLLRHLDGQDDSTQQFLNEARVAALLNHPNVAQIYELGEHDSAPFIVMEHVHGRSLRSIIRALTAVGKSLPVGVAVHVARQIYSGLEYVHSARRDGSPLNLVHRDVTPENVLVSFDGVVKIIDFGIARASIIESLTRPNTIKGKLAYLPPEVLNGEPAGPGVDTFAAALLVCESLLGTNPFRGASENDTAGRVLRCAPVKLRELRADVPSALSDVIERALSRDPAQRASTSDVLQVLEACRSPSAESELRALMVELFADAARDPTAGLNVSLTTPFPVEGEPGPTLITPRRTGAWAAALGAISLSLAGAWLVTRPAAATTPQPPIAAFDVSPASGPGLPEHLDAGVEAPDASVALAPADGPDPKAAPARRRVGTVVLYVKPWAEVYWRGRKLALTPLDKPMELPAGRQELTLKNPSLGLEKRVVVDVRAGRMVTQKVNLAE